MKKRFSILITIFIIVITILMHTNLLYAANLSLRESIMEEDEVVLYFFGYFKGAPKPTYEQKMIKYGGVEKHLFGEDKVYTIDDIVKEIDLPIAQDEYYEINSYNYYKEHIDEIYRLQSKISQLMDDEKFAEEWNSIKDTDEGKLYVGLFNACLAVIQEYNVISSTHKDDEQEPEIENPEREPVALYTARIWAAEKAGFTTINLQYEEVTIDGIQNAVKDNHIGITAERKEDLLDQAEKNIEKVKNCADNGFPNFSHNKEVLLAQLEAVKNGIESLTQSQMSTENGTQAETDAQRDAEKAEKDKTISGTVVMGDNKTEYDGTMENPIDNPEAYKPSESSEDAQRLKEIGQIIISVLKIVGVAVAVIMLMALGLKYMSGGASEKAEYKKSMIPFLIGALVLIVGPQLVGIIYNLVGNIE